MDPELLTKDGIHSSIDYYQPSLDGTLVAYGLSAGWFRVKRDSRPRNRYGEAATDAIDRARFGSIAWLPGNKSFFYNRLQKSHPTCRGRPSNSAVACTYTTLGEDPDARSLRLRLRIFAELEDR